jgi:signal transduction histidine kinase
MNTVAGLAAGMAHEINNPLAGMVQNAQVVLLRTQVDLSANRKAAQEQGTTMEAVRGYLEDRGILEMLEAIRSSGARAAEIIASMLRFSRRAKAELDACALDEILDQAIELASSDFDAKKQYDLKSIEVIRDYAPNLPKLLCRRIEIQQVILNLLKNAAQAMAERGQRDSPPRIVLRLRQEQESLRIEVEDNGPGMPPEIRDRAFQPFFTTKENQSGTGLGLFVSYFIITTNHGGTMTVDSVVGSGTRFKIDLPLKSEA